MPVQFVKGVGPNKSEILAKVGVRTLEDLLFYLPRDHQDRRVVKIKDAQPGKKQAFLVEVTSIDFNRSGKMLGQARAHLKDATGGIDGIWFKRLSFKYDVFSGLKLDITPGKKVLVYGSLEMGKFGVELRVEDHEVLAGEAGDEGEINRIVPVYPLTEGLQDRWLRNLAARIVPAQAAFLQDPMPESFRAAQGLSPFQAVVRE